MQNAVTFLDNLVKVGNMLWALALGALPFHTGGWSHVLWTCGALWCMPTHAYLQNTRHVLKLALTGHLAMHMCSHQVTHCLSGRTAPSLS